MEKDDAKAALPKLIQGFVHACDCDDEEVFWPVEPGGAQDQPSLRAIAIFRRGGQLREALAAAEYATESVQYVLNCVARFFPLLEALAAAGYEGDPGQCVLECTNTFSPPSWFLPGAKPWDFEGRWGDIKRGLEHLARELAVEEPCNVARAARADRDGAPTATPTPPAPEGNSAEWNVCARDYLEKNPLANARDVAKAIDCATGTVSRLPAWQVVMDARRKGRKPVVPRCVTFTKPLEATVGTGEKDEVLNRMIAEQQADIQETGHGHVEDNELAPRPRFTPKKKP